MTHTTKQAIAPLLLRLIIGFGFVAHGWAKISRGTAGFEKLLIHQGVPFPHINSIIGPYTELLGGAAILIGAFVTLVSIPLLFTMIVATFYVQGHYGFSSVKTIGLSPEGPIFGPPGYEINLLYIAGLLSLMLTGADPYSLDYWRKNRKTKSAYPE
ncbi:MAG: DoxX family protein [Bacteroidetes bacterium]|nr:DoxX family protein [Bacteroidota bacterium]